MRLELDQGRDFHSHADRLIKGIERLFPPSPREMTNSIGMKLTLIPAGEFQMGSDESDTDARDTEFVVNPEGEKQKHLVRITRPFYLGVTEVTQGQYQAVMGKTPSVFRMSDDLPVERVSWFDAIEFCIKLSDKETQQPRYRIEDKTVTFTGGYGYRLPTEAEWEYACRAGSTTRYPFGDDENGLGEYAWYHKNAGGKTHPVGQKRANVWGLHDMMGNVWEWCWDGYAVDYYKGSTVDDPHGATKSEGRVVRGGSWNGNPLASRSAHRRVVRAGVPERHLGVPRRPRGLWPLSPGEASPAGSPRTGRRCGRARGRSRSWLRMIRHPDGRVEEEA